MPARRIVVLVAVVLAAGAGAAILWFQPQKAVLDRTVDEAVPTTAPSAQPRATAAGPRVLSDTPFRRLTHDTTGRARVLELPDGSRVVRFEAFETSDGPDVVVWLSTAPADATGRAYAAEFVDLGRLKGNKGDQNYEIPAGTDLSRYRSVVIWCRRFTVPFASAAIRA